MRPIDTTILEVITEAPQIRTLRLDRNLDPYPGQYCMVWIRGLDEVPMSFSGPDTITVQSVGEASEALNSLGKGGSIGLRGPLGRGFTLVGKRILIIGGGVGTAPLAFLGELAFSAGIQVTSLIGYRCGSDMIFLERFQRLGRTITTTDDGSSGICGRVAAGLDDLDLDEYDQIYLCGPELMMWDVISRTQEHAKKTQACINRYFKCAEGICGSCCLDPEGLRVCVEGPVIRADRLLESEFGRYRRGPTGGKGPCKG